MDPIEAPFAAQQAIANLAEATAQLERVQQRVRLARRDVRTVLEASVPDGTAVEFIATVAPGRRQRITIDRSQGGPQSAVTVGDIEVVEQSPPDDREV